jgi:hypothetical protein
MDVFKRLKEGTDWDMVTLYIPGMQPMQILAKEVKDVTDTFLILESTEMDNENGKFTIESSIQLCNIATLDFVTKNTIIGPKKKNGKMIVMP